MQETHERFCCTEISNIGVNSPDKVILDNINMHIHCKELNVIIGKNGAGKSTLLKAILGEINHTGSVSFKSRHTSKNKLTIGYVPQKLNIENSPISVYDLVCSYTSKKTVFLSKNKVTYKKIKEHLKEFGAEELIDRKVSALSGGEMQRVLLTIATMPYPELLILDEPSAGIDKKGVEELYKILTKIKNTQDIAILMVSHDLELVRKYADKVVLLDQKILKKGNAKEVFTSKEFKEVFGDFNYEGGL